MAGSNSIGNTLGVFGALAGARNMGPTAQGNKRFLKRANVVGNWRYGASDPAGLMSQWENTPHLQDATQQDFFNPSKGEMFASLFGAGMGAYGAMSNLTAPLRSDNVSVLEGNNGVTEGNSTESVPTSTQSLTSDSSTPMLMSDAIRNASSREEMFDEAQNTALRSTQFNRRKSKNPNLVEAQAYQDLQPVASPQKAPSNGFLSSTPETLGLVMGNDYMPTASTPYTFGFGCGGHLHGCGGHKFENGGMQSMGGWGNALSTGLNLLSGGLGVALNYAKMRDEMDRADMYATETNAANAYARQLQNNNFNQAVNDTKNNMFNQQALQMMAMGGDLQTHGADFPLFGDFNIIGAGGTHEQNPFGGVFQGVGFDGRPNLVEEDEVVWNNYVFSNRIKIPNDVVKKYKLTEGITYADAAKKLSKEAEERPNDPISQNGMSAMLGDLMNSQEELKAKREEARIKRQIAKMSPEEVMQMMSAIQSAQVQAQQPEQVEQPQISAEGGHLFPWGGILDMFKVLPPYQKSNFEKYIPYVRELARDEVKQREKDPVFEAWTQYVNDNWDTNEVQEYLRALDRAAGGNHLFDKDGKILPTAKDYFNNARTDGKWGYYHLTPNQRQEVQKAVAENKKVPAEAVAPIKEPKSDEVIEEGVAKNAVKPLPTWMRYAPIFGSALGALAASASAKDYSTGFTPRNAHYAPIGDYLPYLPVDTQRYINAENQQAAAQLNAIMNASAGNRNMAMAQAALANQQRQQGIGQRMQAAEQINWDRLRTAGDFNRGTNMFNAQAHNASDIANLRNNPLLLQQEQQNAMMRHVVDNERDAALSASLNTLLDGLGDVGRENVAWNQANSNEALRFMSDPNIFAAGISHYKTPTTGVKNKQAKKTQTTGAPSASAAFGGYLLTKSKKNRR